MKKAIVFLLLLASSWARADLLDDIQKSGKLVWGADQEGGGPYVYPKPENAEEITGFEVDLAEQLAQYLKVKPEFFQGDWNKMPDLLHANKIHVILNGYEWSPTRVEAMDATVPYYVYGLQLLGKKGNPNLAGWDSFAKPPAPGQKWKVGILVGSAAEDEIKKYEDNVEAISYDGNTDAMREVETGKIDATVQDSPIAAFYAPNFPDLAPLGDPVGEGQYVMYVRSGEPRLIQALNEAIILLLRKGELERIYRKYGIWDKNQEKLAAIIEAGKFYGYSKAVNIGLKMQEDPIHDSAIPTQEEVQTAVRKHGFAVFREYGWIMVQSAGMTVLLSLLSFPLAIFVGMLIAIGRMYGPAWLRAPLALYVEFLRGTPLMLQLFFIFYFLPEVGITLSAFPTAILGLAINYSAYESEIYRAGLQAIPVGQMEASLALGMSRALALRRIIVPQAFRIVIPPMMNDFIALFKDTSVCSVITIVELTKRFTVLSQSTQATIELMILTAILYLLMSYPLSIASRKIEKRLERENQP